MTVVYKNSRRLRDSAFASYLKADWNALATSVLLEPTDVDAAIMNSTNRTMSTSTVNGSLIHLAVFGGIVCDAGKDAVKVSLRAHNRVFANAVTKSLIVNAMTIPSSVRSLSVAENSNGFTLSWQSV